jgi:hypothetical protein
VGEEEARRGEKWERRGGKGRVVYGVVPDIPPNGTGFKANSGCPAPYTPLYNSKGYPESPRQQAQQLGSVLNPLP